ncbi:MAG TPA: type I restriction enzyme HsdR N-terminal domain-containing protein [Bacillota bacterium]|nr:type I restriction enzyme HsdR N-terminal domain-containing protein [Bacillota bacterium]
MVVECKKQGVTLTAAHEEQAFGYCLATEAPYMALTNGRAVKAWAVDHHRHSSTSVDELPHFGQLNMEKLQCGSGQLACQSCSRGSDSACPLVYSIRSGLSADLATDPAAIDLAVCLHERISSNMAMFTEPFEWRGHTFIEDMGTGARPLGRIRGCWWDGGYRSVMALSPEGDAYVVRFKVGRSDRDHLSYLYVVVSVGTRNRCRLALCLDDSIQSDVVRGLMETGSGPEFLADLAVEAIRRHVRSS